MTTDNLQFYSLAMIKSFRHAGLEKLFKTGSKAGIQPAHGAKRTAQLAALDVAKQASDLNVPSWHLHPLKGNLSRHWSLRVNGNWRLTFTFEGENAILVDYQDYHGE